MQIIGEKMQIIGEKMQIIGEKMQIISLNAIFKNTVGNVG